MCLHFLLTNLSLCKCEVDRDLDHLFRRYSERLIEIITEEIESFYLGKRETTIKDTYYHIVSRIVHENNFLLESEKIKLPNLSFIRSEIYKIPAYERVKAKKGYQYAQRIFRSVTGSISANKPLERTEIDHTKIDIMVIDDNTMLPLGRPTITACIDVATRCLLGIYIGFEPPSFLTVAQCIKHAVLPKANLHDEFPNIKNEWEPYGVMETLVVDNGLEFHSNHLEALCYPFGITIQYTPRKKPWFKGIIERHFKTMNEGVAHGYPGTTFSKIFEKDDYDSVKNATITLSTFKEIAHKWIVDIYHVDIHKKLGKKPINAWQENIDKTAIPLPCDVSELDSFLGYVNHRILTHKGIEINSIQYNSKALNNLRLKYGSQLKVTVRSNPTNIGYIYVVDPDTKVPLKVNAINFEYASGLSKWQHDVIRRYAREVLNSIDIISLAKAKEEIRELIMRDFKDKRIKTRSKAKRFLNSDIDDSSNINACNTTDSSTSKNKMNSHVLFDHNDSNDTNNMFKDTIIELPKFDVIVG